MIKFQRYGSPVLEKDIPGGNTGKKQGKDLHTIQKKQGICNYKFSKVNALREERSGAQSWAILEYLDFFDSHFSKSIIQALFERRSLEYANPTSEPPLNSF